MQAKIGKELITSLTPKDQPYEINDTALKGFLVRVQPSGAITYWVRYRWNGKQNRVRVGKPSTHTPAMARDEARRILAGLIHGINPAPEKKKVKEHTLKSFIDEEYAKVIEAGKKDGKATVARLKSCFFDDFANTPLNEFSLKLIEHWRTKRILSGKSPSTVNRDITALKSLFTTSVKWGYLAEHPITGIKPSKVDNCGIVRFLSPEEEKKLLEAMENREHMIRDKRESANKWRAERGYQTLPDLPLDLFADYVKPMVLLSMHTGLRWGELAKITWGDVDFNTSILTVRGSTSKAGNTRHIPLNAVAKSCLEIWKKQTAGFDVVFASPDGKTRDNIKKAWKGLLNASQITNFRWHDLRHHFASKLVMAGVDLNTVRELLGHADLKMTLRYAHLAPEHKANAVAKLVG